MPDPDAKPPRGDLALCLLSLVALSPLLWTLCRIIRDVVMDLPMDRPPNGQ